MRRVQLYATGAATASAVANVTIPTAGKLRGVSIHLFWDSSADNSRITIEYSKIPTSQIAVNGSQEPILTVGSYQNGAAANLGAVNGYWPLDVDVRQGEIIYVHANITTATYYANAIFFYA